MLVITTTYQGSYPHLKLAREFKLKYAVVLAVSHWIDTGCPATCDVEPRYRDLIDQFNVMRHHWPREMDNLIARIERARRHFMEQRDGTRGMDGQRI